ncbi:MAG: hypothetical protein WA949_15955 [Phormidesmis sp.]
MSIQKTFKLPTFAFLLSLVAATPALAENQFTVHSVANLSGQGQLEAGDLKLNDDRLADIWPFYSEAGERLSIVLEASNFNPDLWIQWTDVLGVRQYIEPNVDTSSLPGQVQIDFQVAQAGNFEVVVTSQEANVSQGTYAIGVVYSDLPAFTQPQEGRLTASGSLSDNDFTSEDGILFDPLVFSSDEGDELEITVDSTDFDPAILLFYQGEDGEPELLATNDDDNEGTTNAAIQVTIPKSGTFVVVVQGLKAGARGRYSADVRDVNYSNVGQSSLDEALAFTNFMYWNNWASTMDMHSAFYGL